MPIGDLFKTQIFELARWRNRQGYVIPEAVINRAPSAELSSGQKDEDSLPPYAVLDEILGLYLDGGKTAAEIKAQGFSSQTVDWVVRSYERTAFKREQMPPTATTRSLKRISITRMTIISLPERMMITNPLSPPGSSCPIPSASAFTWLPGQIPSAWMSSGATIRRQLKSVLTKVDGNAAMLHLCVTR